MTSVRRAPGAPRRGHGPARLGLAGVLLVLGLALAGSLIGVQVSRSGHHYRVVVDARLDASAEAVLRVLTDFDHLDRLNQDILESQVIGRPAPGRSRVRTLSKVCVALFCKRLLQVQDVERQANGDLVAVMVPRLSDFRSGRASWHFTAEGGGTRMHFVSDMEPAFWVPPLIGPWLIQRALRREARRTLANLDRLLEHPDGPTGGHETDQ